MNQVVNGNKNGSKVRMMYLELKWNSNGTIEVFGDHKTTRKLLLINIDIKTQQIRNGSAFYR